MKLRAVYSPPSDEGSGPKGEVEVAGDADGLKALIAVLRRGSGTVACDDEPDDVYPAVLRHIRVEREAEPAALNIQVDEGSLTLVVSGGEEAMDIIASNTEGFDEEEARRRAAEGLIVDHDHYDYYEGNPYIAPDSVPLVVQLEV